VFDRFAATADALISLHGGWINEALFTIVERVRYGRGRTRAAAENLAARTVRLAEAFDLPIVREYDVDVQEEYALQHSFECAAVNAAGGRRSRPSWAARTSSRSATGGRQSRGSTT